MGIDQLGFQSVQLGYLKILQMGNADPNNTKAGKEYEVKPQPANQLEIISIEPLYPHSVSTGEIIGPLSSGPSAITSRWFSDTTNQSVTNPMIELYLSGTTHLSAGHNVALSQVLNRSKAQYVCMNAMKFKSDFNMHIILDWAVKMRIRPPEFDTSICDAKYHVSLLHSRCHYSDLQDVCIAIGSIATLNLPMVVDLIGIYGLKGPYCTLTTIDWFLQALSVIPRGSWGDVARRFTMIRWATLLVQPDEGVSDLVVDRIGDNLPQSTEKSRIIVIPVGARHKCQRVACDLILLPVRRRFISCVWIQTNYWFYCSFLLIVMSLLMSSSLSAPADLLAPTDLSSSADHDDVTDYIIIDGPLRCSSWFPFDVPAGPPSSSSACSWFLSFQLVHYAPAGSTWPPPDYEQLTQLWTSPLLIQLPFTMINQTNC
ncbi:bromodomain and extraterminal domain protein 9 [Dorcoceras hygrometricum]|uniref:Bromodomain and extraterminal domain protein 9 n=1 Tax=Dorcoceras hygrometricum TaxID=472368 RepID=A0A2Z7CTX1_9LAMI|nr:bromodomain and extraterminal domain protein 9 [Dorcoceras hygrometricum]